MVVTSSRHSTPPKFSTVSLMNVKSPPGHFNSGMYGVHEPSFSGTLGTTYICVETFAHLISGSRQMIPCRGSSMRKMTGTSQHASFINWMAPGVYTSSSSKNARCVPVARCMPS